MTTPYATCSINALRDRARLDDGARIRFRGRWLLLHDSFVSCRTAMSALLYSHSNRVCPGDHDERGFVCLHGAVGQNENWRSALRDRHGDCLPFPPCFCFCSSRRSAADGGGCSSWGFAFNFFSLLLLFQTPTLRMAIPLVFVSRLALVGLLDTLKSSFR